MRQEEKPAIPTAALIAAAALVIMVAVGLVIRTATQPAETVVTPVPAAQQKEAPNAAPATTLSGKPIPKRSGEE